MTEGAAGVIVGVVVTRLWMAFGLDRIVRPSFWRQLWS
jgi:hypothetical protein